MRMSIGTITRALALAAVAVFAVSCGNGNGNKMNTTTPGANAGDNTRVTTIPDVPDADTTKLTPSDRTYTIAKNIWDDYQLYLSRVGRIGNGYYAITEDGLGGSSWSCGDALCGQSYDGIGLAMKSCRDSNPGKNCIIFAKDNYPQVKYEIAP